MSVNGGAAYTKLTAATVNSSVSDSGSGIYQMRIDPGTGTYGAWIAYAATSPITLPPGRRREDGAGSVHGQRQQLRDVGRHHRLGHDAAGHDEQRSGLLPGCRRDHSE